MTDHRTHRNESDTYSLVLEKGESTSPASQRVRTLDPRLERVSGVVGVGVVGHG